MCGLAGYAGVRKESRLPLVLALGIGIDSRGGHAAGYWSVQDSGERITHKALGDWDDQRHRFMSRAADGPMCMMHSRFATSGSANLVANAHPFVVKRGDRTIVGAHNGALWDARESATRFGREMTVDSKEIFELLIDGEEEYLSTLDGYGVVTWTESTSGQPEVFISRLTAGGDLVLATVNEGGCVWASTREILDCAIEFADLTIDRKYRLDVGVVHVVTVNGEVFSTQKAPVQVSMKPWAGYAGEAWSRSWESDGWEINPKSKATSNAEPKSAEDWEEEDDRDSWDRWLIDNGYRNWVGRVGT